MIPAVLRDFIADERTLREAWRYTNVAELAALSAPQQQMAEHNITEDTTLELVVDSDYPHITFKVADGVTFNLVARMMAPVTRDVSLFAAHIHLGAGARMNHVRVTEYAETQSAFLRTTVDAAAGADYRFYTLTAGAHKLRQELTVNLNGEHARASIAAAYVLHGTAHHDFAVTLNHKALNTQSNQYIKGMAADSARAAFCGKIAVAQVAQHTEAYQLHKAMLLGERASIDAKPELEIFADQVRCSHGNAIGALDDDALFFLRARGLGEADARQMLMHAFLADTLDHAPEAQRAMLAERLGRML